MAYNPHENVSKILSNADDTSKEQLFNTFRNDDALCQLDWSDDDILGKITKDPLLKESVCDHLEDFLKKDYVEVNSIDTASK